MDVYSVKKRKDVLQRLFYLEVSDCVFTYGNFDFKNSRKIINQN